MSHSVIADSIRANGLELDQLLKSHLNVSLYTRRLKPENHSSRLVEGKILPDQR